MDIGESWAILIIGGIIFGIILALLRLKGLGIILIIMGVVLGLMVASESAEAGVLVFGVLVIVGILLIRLGIKQSG